MITKVAGGGEKPGDDPNLLVPVKKSSQRTDFTNANTNANNFQFKIAKRKTRKQPTSRAQQTIRAERKKERRRLKRRRYRERKRQRKAAKPATQQKQQALSHSLVRENSADIPSLELDEFGIFVEPSEDTTSPVYYDPGEHVRPRAKQPTRTKRGNPKTKSGGSPPGRGSARTRARNRRRRKVRAARRRS